MSSQKICRDGGCSRCESDRPTPPTYGGKYASAVGSANPTIEQFRYAQSKRSAAQRDQIPNRRISRPIYTRSRADVPPLSSAFAASELSDERPMYPGLLIPDLFT